DKVEMLISVNKGEEPKPINKIASGGELSRIMLAIKNVLASNDNIPTMIFDEIDTGISGHAAQKVGIKLSEISEKRQVLCVTHLAQIAAMADNHLLIRKSSDENRTYTKIYPLDFEERKKEIARIISGDSDSEITLKSAEELLLRKSRQS
ncbi:MAG: DNA repair protein RecN, partial [Ruminiclostridium sp.]